MFPSLFLNRESRESYMSKLINLVGQKFGRLTVLKRVENDKNGQSRWLCRCSCPEHNEVIVISANLRKGGTKSCGCYSTEMLIKRSTKHGHKNDTIYNVWARMKQRCNNPKDPGYADYMGRGIKVCKRWENSFQAFYDDVSKLPHFGEKGYSINRIDNDGNYEPGNVEWSTPTEQANNRRNSQRIPYNGEEHSLTEWGRILNISYRVLRRRINELGWPIEKALTTPVMDKYSHSKTP